MQGWVANKYRRHVNQNVVNEPTGRVGNRAFWILRDGNIDVSAYTRQMRDQPGTRMVPEYVGIDAQEGALGLLTPACARQLAAVLNAAADAAESSEIVTTPTDSGTSQNADTSLRVGQVWAYNDPWVKGRTVKVEAIEREKALCRVLAAPFDAPEGRTGHTTRISVRRFRPTSSGYRLIREADGALVEEV